MSWSPTLASLVVIGKRVNKLKFLSKKINAKVSKRSLHKEFYLCPITKTSSTN